MLAMQFQQKHRATARRRARHRHPRAAERDAVVTKCRASPRPSPGQGRQSVRAANEIRGARGDDPLGTLDIAEFVIDQRLVACLLWVTSGKLRDEHLSPGYPPIADLCLEPTAIAGAQDLAENEIAVFGLRPRC